MRAFLKLYRRLRLDGYRKLFGAVQEREGSLSAMEAFSADLINLLGEPTLRQFAEYSGISSRMRPTRSMRWRARGMWKKSYPPQTGGRSG